MYVRVRIEEVLGGEGGRRASFYFADICAHRGIRHVVDAHAVRNGALGAGCRRDVGAWGIAVSHVVYTRPISSRATKARVVMRLLAHHGTSR